MMDKDVQSVTQADIDAAKALLALWGGNDDDLRVMQEAFCRHRLASQPTSAEDAVAWIWHHKYAGRTVMFRPLDDDARKDGFGYETPLYTHPTPDTQTAAIGAEAILKLRFPYVEQQGVNRAVTVHWFDVVRAVETALSQPVAAPQAEMAGGEDGLPLALRQARYVLRSLHNDTGEQAYLKLATACEMAADRLSTPPQPEGGTVAREAQAVWRCAVGDFVGAVDVLKNRWINSRRKHEREAGEELNRLASLIWAARSPAPESYDDARKAGTALIERVRAALQPEKTK